MKRHSAVDVLASGLTPNRRHLLGAAAALCVGGRAMAAEDLPVLHPNDVILFQGDSITDGGRQPGPDFNHNMGQDYDYILAAQLGARFAKRNLTFLNRGVGGNSVIDLAARWRDDVLALKPDLLSILVGVNDTFFRADESAERFETVYDQLLADTRAALPNVKIVLGQPFMLPVGPQIAQYDAHRLALKQRQDVVVALAQRYRMPMIAYQEIFDAAAREVAPEHWSWDGVHPTYAGHWLMAQEWLRTVGAAWPNG